MNIVVLGAGPGGLCVAWNLVKDGHRVIVLEKEPVYGGQSVTFSVDGFSYDLGPHNIHSRRQSVIDFLAESLGDRLVEHQILPQIYFRRRRINYPLVGIQVLKLLPPVTSVACGLSFLWSRVWATFDPTLRDDGSYETWVVNRFGRRFYDIFFGPYSRKAWGIPPLELSDQVAKKRIAIRGIGELLRSVLFRSESDHPENPRLVRQYYPREGVGEIVDFFASGIKQGGGEILTGCTVDGIALNGDLIEQLSYVHGGRRELLDCRGSGKDSWQVISTIPLSEMVLMLDGQAPQQVKTAAQELDFTSEIFLYLNLRGPDALGVSLLYFGEEEFPFNRIYDVGLFSRNMVPDGKNAICIELTCSYDDEMWRSADDVVFEKCMSPLEKHKLLGRGQVDSYLVRRLRHAYPRFRIGYQDRLRSIFSYLETITNLSTIGREGLFSYANVDDVIWMGFQVAKHLCYRDRMKLSIQELLPEYIDF